MRKFEEPKVEIMKIETEDVITTSPTTPLDENEGDLDIGG